MRPRLHLLVPELQQLPLGGTVTRDDDYLREFVEEERDRHAVRAWYGNIAFFAVLAVLFVGAVLLLLLAAAG